MEKSKNLLNQQPEKKLLNFAEMSEEEKWKWFEDFLIKNEKGINKFMMLSAEEELEMAGCDFSYVIKNQK